MENTYKADLTKATKEKTYYSLAMFPYPSGAGLHVGHGTNFTANDVVARFKRMQGYTVINPIGWDSFGLPTENYAMKLGRSASEVTAENIANYKKQCELMDWSYDWDREVATSSPEYYKWTQWIFQQLFKAGLVYKKDSFVNRCPSCQTVLANDQVVDGKCERCDSEIIQKKHPQRFIKITDYAERLIDDLDLIDRPEETKTQQKYWIGKSEGAEIDFAVDTGATTKKHYVVLHGYEGNIHANWLPRLAKNLQQAGHTVDLVELPNSAAPIVADQVKYVLDTCTFDENTIVIGHSLGCTVALKALEKISTTIEKCILVAGFLTWEVMQDPSDPDYAEEKKFFDHVNATFDRQYDLEAAKKHCKNFVVLHDQNDYAVQLSRAQDLAKKLDTTPVIFEATETHACGKEEPVILEYALENDKQNIFMLHGKKRPETNTIDGWQLRIKEQMKEKGYTVENPLINDSRKIYCQDWENYINQYKSNINHNTTLIGHSAGAAAIVRWLGNNPDVMIKKLILIAPAKISSGDEKLISTQTGEILDPKEYEGIKDLYNFVIDSTIKNRVSDGVFVLTSNDEKRLLDSADMYIDVLGATHIILENRQHFQSSLGEINQTLPELIDIIEDKKSEKITVFTTRPDTLFGVTALVLAPENASIDAYIPAEYKQALTDYRLATSKKTNIERQADAETKSGVFSGVYAIHPLTQEKVPVRFADYVLPDYATGAVMFVPAHDERDWSFAQKHGLGVKQVVLSQDIDINRTTELLNLNEEIISIAKNIGCDIYLSGGISIPFLLGVIYRNHIDLDYVIRTGDKKILCELLSNNGYTILNEKDSGVVVLQKNNIEIEIGLPTEIIPGYISFDNNYSKKNHSLRGYVAPSLDFDFILATKKAQIVEQYREKDEKDVEAMKTGAYTASGRLINSAQFDGLDNQEAKKAITQHLAEKGLGKAKTTYKLRDWSVSRQRYWGSPIPVYYTFAENEKVDFLDSYENGHIFGKEWNYNPQAPVVNRDMIYVLLHDVHTDRYMTLDWGNLGTSLIAGGIEDGETITTAAIREAQEESGYKDVTFVKQLEGELHQLFYHSRKSINYYSPTFAALCEVDTSSAIQNLDPAEAAKHTPVWKTLDEIMAGEMEVGVSYFLNILLGNQKTQTKTIDRYNAYNPHPNKDKRIPNLIPEEQLPVVLPLDLGDYKPAGKSPLADHPTFPHYHAPDGKVYLRECDTLDTFMCSSFYYLRFIDPTNTKELISKEFADKALPVDFYIGGKEHTYGHLLYSRFIHKFLFDQGVVPSAEPFQKLFHQGMVLGPDGRKMSKRRGNVITPGDLVEKYGTEMGADVLRTYTMFMGPLEVEKAWNDNAVDGVKRFLDRVARVMDFVGKGEASNPSDDKNSITFQTTIQLHKTIKGVTEDIEKLKFNTAISKLMVFVNHIYDVKQITKEHFATFLQLLAPFATKLSQNLWVELGQKDSIHTSIWPVYDESYLAEDSMQLPVQINGKMRGTLDIKKGLTQDEVFRLVQNDEKLAVHLGDITANPPKKVIFVQDKIMNIIL